ncbi:DUF1572 family protein [Rhodohalobacter sp. 8-1]|uniref:DUF1572 family protein n=1 Tax=Rhodohalobacter sp. 8-1 TaxID=3131972 RepID=UPI0030EE393E
MILEYLTSTRQQFVFYKEMGDKTFNQLEDEDLFWQYNDQSNSIAILVSHLSGNMISRWTDFLTTDGEKEWRKRDEEFEPVIKTRDELLTAWEKGWACLFDGFDTIDESNFDTKIYIRNEEHSIIKAVNRQLAHCAYHVGQIVYIAKMIKSDDWKSLSIPKGESSEFNEKKFSKGGHSGSLTNDLS